MNLPTETYLRALERLRKELPDLLPGTEAARLEADLGRVLAADDPEAAVTLALEAITDYPAARERLRELLQSGDIEEESPVVDGHRGFAPLPGEPEVEATAYRCPRCGRVYRLPQKGYPVPPCPVDGSELEPERKEGGG